MPDDVSAQQRQAALEVHQRLLDAYGQPDEKEQRDPLSELMLTILTQNTSDTNSGRAYRRLRERFPTWEAVRQAPEDAVADAIRPGGLANVKAPRMQRILDTLHDERGALDLGFLDDLPVDEARDYLLDMPGVGPKTAACVLLFSLHKEAMPVDTHVHRVALRLGLIPEKTSAEKAHTLLEAMLPAETYYPFHLNMIHHGRTVCHAQSPDCEACALTEVCDYYHDVVLPQREDAPESEG